MEKTSREVERRGNEGERCREKEMKREIEGGRSDGNR